MTLLVLRVRELPQPIAYRVLGPSGTLLVTAAKKPGQVVAVVGPRGRDGEPGGGGRGDKIDVINAVAGGQVQFMLSEMPVSPALVRMFINGTRYRPPDFTVAGQTITWRSPFSIAESDEIEFTYPI